MIRGTGGLIAALGGIGTLAAALLILVKKGPIAGALLLLAMAAVLLAVSILSALVNRKKADKR